MANAWRGTSICSWSISKILPKMVIGLAHGSFSVHLLHLVRAYILQLDYSLINVYHDERYDRTRYGFDYMNSIYFVGWQVPLIAWHQPSTHQSYCTPSDWHPFASVGTRKLLHLQFLQHRLFFRTRCV